MIATLTLICVLAQGQLQSATPARPSAGQIISAMLAHYSKADTMAGRIRLTVSAGGEAAALDTFFQYDQPSLVYVRQVSSSDPKHVWLVVSDGKRFSYNVPSYMPTPDNERLLEAVNQEGVVMSFREIYGVGGSTLKDRNLPLDVAFGRSADLAKRREQWATHAFLGVDQINGESLSVVGGDWREYLKAPTSGTYRMWISSKGDLRRYEETSVIGIPDPSRKGVTIAQRVIATWDVDIKIGAETDKSLYKLP